MGKTVVTGDPPAEPKVPLDTVERVLKELHDINENIQNDTGEREKLEKGIGEVMEAVNELRVREKSKMRFDAGATKELIRGGLKRAMLVPTKDERLKALQELSDDVHIVDGILGHTKRAQNYGGLKSLEIFAEFEGMRSDFAKAMDTAEAGAGAEWVPTDTLSGELLYAIDIEGRVMPLIPSFDMPQSPYTWPLMLNTEEAYRATETTDIDSVTKAAATTLGTAKKQLDAEKIMGRVGWSGELDAKSIIVMLPEIKGALVKAHARAKDKAGVNGQITGVIDTADDPSGTATDVRNCWDGFRYYCNANSSEIDIGANWDAEGVSSVHELLGASGLNPEECMWLPSVSTYYKLLRLKDNAGNQLVLAPWLYGAAATILTGKIGQMYGIPIVPTPQVRDDLNASGIYDNVTKTKTVLILVHKPSWKYGRFGGVTVRASDLLYMESDALVVVSKEMGDLQAMFPFANQVAAAQGFNITV